MLDFLQYTEITEVYVNPGEYEHKQDCFSPVPWHRNQMLAVVGKLHPSDNLCKTKNKAKLVILSSLAMLVLPYCYKSVIYPKLSLTA